VIDFVENSIKALIVNKSTTIVFGANIELIRKTERALHSFGKRIDFIVDNDFKLDETKVLNYHIKSFEFIKNFDKNAIAIIVDNNKEKHIQLNAMGMLLNHHYFLINDVIFPTAVSTGYSRNVYAPWFADEEFLSVYTKMRSNTLVDITRCYELASLVKQTQYIQGDVLEVGVWRGGTGFLLTHYAKKFEKTVYLADTFKGVAKTDTTKDLTYTDGAHNDTNFEIPQELFDRYGYDNKVFLKGIFPDDTSSLIKDKIIAFCHIDVDVYQSAKMATEWVWERMPVGGIVVFDDYGFPGCNGVTDYVNETINLHDSDRQFLYNLNGHGIFD